MPADLLSRARRAIEEATKQDPKVLPLALHKTLSGDILIVDGYDMPIAETDADGYLGFDADIAPLVVLAVNASPALLDVYEAAKALRHKMREVYADSRYMNVWATAQERLGPYSGPDWIAESAALDSALARLETLGKEVAP